MCLGTEEVECLGHHVSVDGILLSEKKKLQFLELTKPEEGSSLRAFLGLANYFRDLIPIFAMRSASLAALLSPRVKFEWSAEADKEF